MLKRDCLARLEKGTVFLCFDYQGHSPYHEARRRHRLCSILRQDLALYDRNQHPMKIFHAS